MHNLSYNEQTQKYEIFTTKPAWHGLSTVVSEAQTSEQAMELANLSWGVTKRPIYTNGDNDELMLVPDKYATVRMDTNAPLGVVGNRYHILQNKDAFKFIDTIVGEKSAVFETAGALGKGERIFITAKLPERMVVGMDDVADNYLFLSHTHDGSGSIEVMFTPTFVCCANTVKMALSNGKRKQRVRHTAGVNGALLKAADLMGITRENIQDKQELFNSFTKVRISDRELRNFIERVMGTPEREQINKEEWSSRFKNQVDKIVEYGLSDPAQLIVERKGTLWGGINAISGYYNNVANYKGEEKLQSIIYGSGSTNINKAFDLAMNVMTGQLSLS